MEIHTEFGGRSVEIDPGEKEICIDNDARISFEDMEYLYKYAGVIMDLLEKVKELPNDR